MKHRKGFTLIELLVVIVIIAILAAILFPVFMTAKTHSQKGKCLGNLKQLGTAINLYCDDYDDRLPWATCFAKGWRDYGWSYGNCLREVQNGVEIGVLKGYVKNDRVWFCPTFPGKSVICEYQGVKITASQNQTTYIWVAHTWDRVNNRVGHILYGLRRSEIPRASRQMVIHEAPYAEPGAHNHITNVAFADGHAGSFNTRDARYWAENGDVWTAYSDDGWYKK